MTKQGPDKKLREIRDEIRKLSHEISLVEEDSPEHEELLEKIVQLNIQLRRDPRSIMI